MKILIIGSSRRIGLGFHSTVTAIAMKNLGIDVTVMSPARFQFDGLPKMLSEHRIKLIIYKKTDSLKIKDMLASNFLLKSFLKKENPEIILAEGVNQLFKTLLYKRNNSNLKGISIAGSLPSRNVRQYIFLLDKVTDYTIALCQYTKKELIKGCFNPLKIIVTPLFSPYLPLFDEWKKRSISLEKYGLKDITRPVIFYGAYHYPWKGFEYFTLAAKIVLKKYDATFVIGGAGPKTEYLKELVNKLGLNKHVIFTGIISPLEDLYPILYQVVDIAVSSSLREQFPSYILEVMAAGKPIVATDVGGVREQVFNGYNGYIVPPKNYKVLADKIMNLIEDNNLREEMKLKSRKLIEKIYNREEAIKRFLSQIKIKL
ncbi:MAG: glycosyltransferase family 4 protein [Nitrososphaeria archaeon]